LLKTLILEYRTTVFINTKTDEKFAGEFPKGVNAPVQFGTEVKTLVVYLRDCQHISYERVAELLSDVFGVSISEATVVNMVKETGNSLVLNKFETAAIKDFHRVS
jgi:transposase